MSPAKGPLYVKAREPMTPQEAGRLGARKRWGEPRVLRLDTLTPAQKRLVLALVDLGAEADPAGGAPADPSEAA